MTKKTNEAQAGDAAIWDLPGGWRDGEKGVEKRDTGGRRSTGLGVWLDLGVKRVRKEEWLSIRFTFSCMKTNKDSFISPAKSPGGL